MQKYCNIVKSKLHSLIRSMEKNVSYFVVDPKRDFVRKSELSFSKTMKFRAFEKKSVKKSERPFFSRSNKIGFITVF